MKKVAIFFAFALFGMITVQGQSGKEKSLPKTYLFEKFIKGKVLSKSGAIDEAPLDYNAEDQSIIFFRDGQNFILTNLETIDTIYIDGRKFVPVGNTVYEVLANSSPVSLLVSYHSKTRPMTSITNHDSTTKKSSNDVSNAVTDIYVTRPFNGDNLVEIQQRYWLIRGSELYKANTEKQFSRVFANGETAVRNYIRETKIDFNKPEDMVRLLAYGNTQVAGSRKK